jgi:GT2 family glycosyltransferase
LTELVNFNLSKHEKLGICGAKLLQYYHPKQLQGVGGSYNKWIGAVKEIGFNQDDIGQWDSTSFSFDYVLGASMFILKKFLEDVGLMDEEFFLYYEELDWAIRGKKKGWSLGFCASARIYHKMGSSINKNKGRGNSLIGDYYSIRNRILLTKKYFPYALVSLYPSFLKFVYNRIRLKQFSRIKLLVKVMSSPDKHFDSSKV